MNGAAGDEWDWPPRRPQPTTVEGRIRSEQIVLPRKVPKPPSKILNRAAERFGTAIYMLCRGALIVALAGVLFGSLSLIGIILSP